MVLTLPLMPARDWAWASGMYTLGGLLPCGTLTIPITLKLVLAMVTVEPMASFFCVA